MARHTYLQGQKLIPIFGALLLAMLWLCPVLYAQETPREKLERSSNLLNQSSQMANYAKESDIALIQQAYDMAKQGTALIQEVINEAEKTDDTELKIAAVTGLNNVGSVFTQIIKSAQTLYNRNIELAIEAEKSGDRNEIHERTRLAKGAVNFISNIAGDTAAIGELLSTMASEATQSGNIDLARAVTSASRSMGNVLTEVQSTAEYLSATSVDPGVLSISNHMRSDVKATIQTYSEVASLASSIIPPGDTSADTSGTSTQNGEDKKGNQTSGDKENLGVRPPWPFHWNYLPMTDKQGTGNVPIQDTEPASPFGAK